MQTGRYMPISAQAEITRKCHFDIVEIRKRGLNTDPDQAYKMGEKTDFWVMPGELVFAVRERHNYSQTTGTISERGFTSLNGLSHQGYASVEALMDDYYFVGIAKTEFEYGGDHWANQDPLDHGFSVIGAGSYSTNNHGPAQIHAGDVLVWEFPPFDENKGLKYKRNYKEGTPYTKVLPYLRPLRVKSCESRAIGIKKLMDTDPNENGVNGLDKKAFEERDLTPAQEEALHIKLAFAKGDSQEGITHLCLAGYMGMMTQFSRVVGVALNSAAQGQTLHVMLSHYKCN